MRCKRLLREAQKGQHRRARGAMMPLHGAAWGCRLSLLREVYAVDLADAVVKDHAVDPVWGVWGVYVAGSRCFAIHVDTLDGKLPDAGEYNAVDPDLARQMTMNLRQLSFMNEALNWRRKSLR